MSITLGLSRCCLVLFFRQLFTKSNWKIWRACTILVAVLICWTVASTLTVAYSGSPGGILESDGESDCGNRVRTSAAIVHFHYRLTAFQRIHWQVVVAIDVCFEALMVIMPAYVFSTLQMTITRKVTVTLAFGFRLRYDRLFPFPPKRLRLTSPSHQGCWHLHRISYLV